MALQEKFSAKKRRGRTDLEVEMNGFKRAAEEIVTSVINSVYYHRTYDSRHIETKICVKVQN